MCNALQKDLHKSRQESMINEIEFLRNDVRSLIMNLRSLAATEYVSISYSCMLPTNLCLTICEFGFERV